VANLTLFNPLSPGVFLGAYFIFFAFGGFARVAVVAGEVKDAAKNVPKAILYSLAISSVLYVLVGFVAVGLAGPGLLAESMSPLSDAIAITGNRFAVGLISAGAMVATATVALSSIMGASRMAYAIAARGELPQVMHKLHPKYPTPYYGIWIVTALMSVLILATDLTRVVAISTFAHLFYYIISNISVLRLKLDGKRYPYVISILGILACLALLIVVLFERPDAWIVGLAAIGVGVIYYVAKRRFTHRKG
jgi:basic amino acid/polyamine antiporter, APA family